MKNIQYFSKILYLSSILGTLGYVLPGLSQTVLESPFPSIKQAQNISPPKPTPSNLQIIDIDRQNKTNPITSNTPLTVTIKGTPGVVASVLLVADKHTVRETPAKEISPGIYQATIYFDSSTRIVEGVIMARLQQGRQVIYDAADLPFSVTTVNQEGVCTLGGSQPSLFSRCNLNSLAPNGEVNSKIPLRFTSHRNGEKVNGNNLVVMGKTQPNAQVNIKVNSTVPLVGNFLLQLEGKTLVDQTITADKNGNFSFMMPQGIKTVSGSKYTINAIAIVQDQTSKLVKLTLQQN